ncbi:MAG: UvrD-helicase domain-containing protein [Anaerolineales bacterium]|nr:UvrD-helicase domain-containing protein [Anaerolineales bacterium]
MAHILPDTPPLSLPGEVLRVFRALKALPDSFFIWHHLAPWQLDAPDFLMITQDDRVLLVKVSSAAAIQAAPAAQFLLLESERAPLGQAEAQSLANFVDGLKLPDGQALETLVVFPNITDEQTQASRLERGNGDPAWAGKELLNPDSGLGWDAYFPSTQMDALWLEKVRQRFTPEIVVPAEMTVHPPVERRRDAGLTDYLLDYDQEWAVKADLDLPAEGHNLTDDFRLNIINGVAGSGKTLILLYRLRLLYHLYPEKRFLVLTHNRPLSHDMQGRFARLEGHLPPSETIEWRTFNGWCYHHWPKQPGWVEPLTLAARQRLIDEIWRKHLGDSSISAQMFKSEMDWFKDQIPMNGKAYLAVDRRGRGFGLSVEQRRRVYAAILAYQQSLEARHTLDWGEVPRRLWQYSESGQVQFPKYDVVLVDEAQFFAPLWVRMIQKLLNPKNGHLFLVADPTQGFLGRGASWKSFGLEARGRTHQLLRSYRSTREIMQFATLLYRLRLAEEKDDDILAPDLLNMPTGAFPQIISLTSPQDEIARLANEVAGFVRQGYPKKHLLLLHSDGNGVKSLIMAINERLGKDAARDPKTDYPGDYVRVTTLNAGAGLESPIVFLAGLREMLEEEQSLRLSDDERETLIRDNTRKIYMAVTRAGQRLVLTCAGEFPEALKTAFGQIS